MTRYVLGVLAYLGPTFALGYLWHLVLFQSYYEALAFHGGGSRAVRPGPALARGNSST